MIQFPKLSSKCEDHFFNSSNSKPHFTNISHCTLFKDEQLGHVLSSSAVRQNRHVTFWTGRSGQLVLTNDMCSMLVTHELSLSLRSSALMTVTVGQLLAYRVGLKDVQDAENTQFTLASTNI